MLDQLRAVSGCFAFKPAVSAGCSPSFTGSREPGRVSTRAGLAPPLYYALTGAPLRTFPSSRGLYAARLVSASIAAALVATAITLASRSRSPLLIAGIVVAWTPMSLFLTGVLSPNGLELAAALLLWVSAAIFLSSRDDARPDPLLAAGLGLACSAYALSRQLSPLWVLLTLVCLAPLLTRSRLRQLVRRSGMRLAMALSAASIAAATLWLVGMRPLTSPRGSRGPEQSTFDAVATSFGRLGVLYRQAIGTFGWLDTPSPNVVVWTWTGLLATLLVIAFALGGRRWKVSLALCAITTIVVPPLIEASQVEVQGLVWQGRYTLPLAMGLPILAGRAADLSARNVADWAAIAKVVVLLAVPMQGVAYYVALRRYAVGVFGPVWFVGSSQWQPPIPTWSLLVLGCGTLLVAAAGLVHLIATSSTGAEDAPDTTRTTQGATT